MVGRISLALIATVSAMWVAGCANDKSNSTPPKVNCGLPQNGYNPACATNLNALRPGMPVVNVNAANAFGNTQSEANSTPTGTIVFHGGDPEAGSTAIKAQNQNQLAEWLQSMNACSSSLCPATGEVDLQFAVTPATADASGAIGTVDWYLTVHGQTAPAQGAQQAPFKGTLYRTGQGNSYEIISDDGQGHRTLIDVEPASATPGSAQGSNNLQISLSAIFNNVPTVLGEGISASQQQ